MGKKSMGEILAAQIPGVVGLGLIGAGLGMVWYAKTYPPHRLYTQPVVGLIVAGLVCLGYWAFN